MSYGKRVSLFMSVLAVLVVLVMLSDWAQAGSGKPRNGDDLVFTCQPRDKTPVGGADDASNWQRVSDSGHVHRFSQSNLCLKRNDKVKVWKNCTNSKEICAYMEARPSPDNTKIAFVKAKGVREVAVQGVNGPPTHLKDFDTVHAELWVCDQKTDQCDRLTSGHIDRTPSWLDNDTLLFASSRGGIYPSLGPFGNAYYPHVGLQIFRMDLDGSNLSNLTPEEQLCMNPNPTTEGEILMSCWAGFGDRGAFKTPRNFWWGYIMSQWGENKRAWLGAHGSPELDSRNLTEFVGGNELTNIKTLRPIIEIKPDKCAAGNYYRGNKHALGEGFEADCHNEAEGVSAEIDLAAAFFKDPRPGTGRYVPSSLVNITPYGNSQDTTLPRFRKSGEAVGNAGYFFPLPGYAFGLTQGAGHCYDPIRAENATRKAMGGTLPCHKYIAASKKPVATDPKDLHILACGGGGMHCWEASALVEYQELFGQPIPKPQPKPKGDECRINIVDLRGAELIADPRKPSDRDRINFQGNAHEAYSALVDEFQIHTVQLWDRQPVQYKERGFKSKSLFASVKPMDDGSISMVVPCETPIAMSAVDQAGNTVAEDLILHSLRTGETRTCHGCHDGHSEKRAKALGNAEERFKSTDSYAKWLIDQSSGR